MQVKTKEELDIMRYACQVASAAHVQVLPARNTILSLSSLITSLMDADHLHRLKACCRDELLSQVHGSLCTSCIHLAIIAASMLLQQPVLEPGIVMCVSQTVHLQDQNMLAVSEKCCL